MYITAHGSDTFTYHLITYHTYIICIYVPFCHPFYDGYDSFDIAQKDQLWWVLYAVRVRKPCLLSSQRLLAHFNFSHHFSSKSEITSKSGTSVWVHIMTKPRLTVRSMKHQRSSSFQLLAFTGDTDALPQCVSLFVISFRKAQIEAFTYRQQNLVGPHNSETSEQRWDMASDM